ncbi:hypothetical protein [Candidatus Poriferisodalis sp.]|uniref:hypothetical protein n=1 Tax=Candidatus Poriferisodalis sp. TaxID=3101277 RepID=UPI003B02D740
MAVVAAHLGVASTMPAQRQAPAQQQAPARRMVGLRVVGVAALCAAGAIAVLTGLAAFHSMLAAGQYRLSELESEIAVERERLIDLRYELQTLHGPAEIELMGIGALGLVNAADPIDLRIQPRHIAAADQSQPVAHQSGDWLWIKSLLTDASTAHDRRS